MPLSISNLMLASGDLLANTDCGHRGRLSSLATWFSGKRGCGKCKQHVGLSHANRRSEQCQAGFAMPLVAWIGCENASEQQCPLRK